MTPEERLRDAFQYAFAPNQEKEFVNKALLKMDEKGVTVMIFEDEPPKLLQTMMDMFEPMAIGFFNGGMFNLCLSDGLLRLVEEMED